LACARFLGLGFSDELEGDAAAKGTAVDEATETAGDAALWTETTAVVAIEAAEEETGFEGRIAGEAAGFAEVAVAADAVAGAEATVDDAAGAGVAGFFPQSFLLSQFGLMHISKVFLPFRMTFMRGVLQNSQTVPRGTINALPGRG